MFNPNPNFIMSTTINCAKIAVIQVGLIILPVAELDVDELLKVSNIYTAKVLSDMKTEFLTAQSKYGLDNKTDHLGTTVNVKALCDAAKKLLPQIKVTAEIKYIGREEELNLLFTSLGIQNTFPKTKKETLEMFLALNQNLPEKKSVLIDSGVNTVLLDELQTISTSYISAATNQGIKKNKSTRLTAEDNIEILDLYNKITNLCKFARAVFNDSPEKQRQYNFSLIASAFAKPRSKKADAAILQSEAA